MLSTVPLLLPVAQWLNTVYQALDGLLDRYGGSVTKIETVRDAFAMCYCGGVMGPHLLPSPLTRSPTLTL